MRRTSVDPTDYDGKWKAVGPQASGRRMLANVRARRQAAQQLQSTLFRAYRIGELAVFYGDPNLINTTLGKIQNVGKDDIQRVAKTYLTEENRTVITTLPKPKVEPAKAAN